MGEIVRSEWMVDPSNPNQMVRRNSASTDRDYWDRVSQGDNVFSAARMFENVDKEATSPSFPAYKPGKLNRQSFIDLFNNNSCEAVSEVRTGRLDMNGTVWETGEVGLSRGDTTRESIKVGKLNTKNLFQGEPEPVKKPQIKIGKLGPIEMIDSRTEDKENRETVKVGRINHSFNKEKEEGTPTTTTAPVKVGKLDIGNMFGKEQDQMTGSSEATDQRRVGKLKLEESGLFEDNVEPRADQRPRIEVGKLARVEDMFQTSPPPPTANQPVVVGKLRTEDMMFPASTCVETKFYKPTVTPKKMKIDQLFPAQDTNQPQKEEVRVGKLSKTTFEPVEESPTPSAPSPRIGKIDTSKLFSQDKEEEEGREAPKREVRKLNLDKVFEASNSQDSTEQSSPCTPPIQVGRLKASIFQQTDTSQPPSEATMRGARRRNKGNRISCLIENLGTPTQEEEEEQAEADREVEDNVKLGKNRLSELQNIFSGSPGCSSESPRSRRGEEDTPSEICELKDEGLVAANLQRFTTGNILGNQAAPGRRLSSTETNYIDKRHIESVTAKFEVGGSSDPVPERRESLPVGKLKNPQSFLQPANPGPEDSRQKIRVGKLSSEAFKVEKDEQNPSYAPTREVGKLNADSLFTKPQEEEPVKAQPKVGKLSTKDLFENGPDEEPTHTEESVKKVGKLSGDRFQLSSETENQEREQDTHIVPQGKVSKSASAFIHTKANSSSSSSESGLTRSNTTRRSKSGDAETAEMQRKYQQQLQSAEKKRVERTASMSQKTSTPTLQRSSTISSSTSTSTSMSNSTATSLKTSMSMQADKVLSEEKGETREEEREEVRGVKLEDARATFFKSMMTTKSQTSSAQRLGTSILPPGGGSCPGSSRGKALFQRKREEEEEREEVSEISEVSEVSKSEVISGVDFEDLEDEFERLHREMIGEE